MFPQLRRFHLDTPVSVKLWGLVLFLSVMLTALFGYTYWGISAQKADSTVINDAGRQRMLTQRMSKTAEAIYSGKTDRIKNLRNDMQLFDRVLDGLINGGTKKNYPEAPNDTIRERLVSVREQWEPFQDHLNALITARQPEKINGSSNITAEEAIEYVRQNNLDLLTTMNSAVSAWASHSSSKIRTMLWNEVIGIVLAISFVFLLSYVLISRMSRVVGELSVVGQKLSVGDLDQKLEPTDAEDELGNLKNAFRKTLDRLNKLTDQARAIAELDLNREVLDEKLEGDLGQTFSEMVEKLEGFVRELNQASDDASTATNEVNEAAEKLNRMSTQLESTAMTQSESLEQTSSAVEEMTAMVQETSENASECNELSEKAVARARDGRKQIEEMADVMEEINRNSQEVAEAIEVIDDIAFQTNLLALNAAVEAANAGEHGEGFAVVADEVRELAQRSAEAADEIQDIIETSVAQTEKGTEKAAASREVLAEISGSVSTVNERIEDVATASQEQSRAIEEVNKSITELEGHTDDNAAHAEETATSSEELTTQARTLDETIDNLQRITNQFTLDSIQNPKQNGTVVTGKKGKTEVDIT